jgi:predicted AlkP superfamily phosphohydrolase/phosphomutase
MRRLRFAFLTIIVLLAACGRRNNRKLIVIGVDGMDPAFVERHWSDLPHLDRLRREGSFSRLGTTTPPQSPVAWSTFITGLDPAEHGIFDFVHRDPATHEPYLSTDRLIEPRFKIPLGPYELPLSRARVESLRRGKAFWQTLSERKVPVTIVRMPVNYPPLPYGEELSGMETPDLRGTQGTFSFFTDDSEEMNRGGPGSLIRKVEVNDGHVDLTLEGPPNSLRKDDAYATVSLGVDIDPLQPYARIRAGKRFIIVRQGEWSEWIPVDFSLIPGVISARGMVRVFAKQLHPGFALYFSPVNIDPEKPALPISVPSSLARDLGASLPRGRFATLGIPEDTAALRQGVFDLPQFLSQTQLVLNEERGLLDAALSRYSDGFLFFYFSSVDQNSHILWGKHEPELLRVYKAVDASIGDALRREPGVPFMVMSDHGFSTFDTAVDLNTWLLRQGFLEVDANGKIDWLRTRAYAMGLNAVYVTGANRNDLRRRLLDFHPAIESVTEIHPSKANRSVAPDFVVGYAPGYRASWQTGLGEVSGEVLAPNQDAWIADHCIDAREVPGVLFATQGIADRARALHASTLKDLGRVILDYFQE